MLLNQQMVRWCAQQVQNQEEDAIHVSYMFNALVYAYKNKNTTLIEGYIRGIHALVMNGTLASMTPGMIGFRITPVLVCNMPVIDYKQVPRAMSNLVNNRESMTPIEFVYEFLQIHPFTDGNGRTAAILFNWRLKTLDRPVDIPLMRFSS